MYIQITTLCNMTCAHCCYSCGPTKPFSHMDRDVYQHCVSLCENTGEAVQLGGGEPTCHPKFWEYLRYAVSSATEGVWLATNGKRSKHALALATLASPDGWHDMHYEWAENHMPEEDADVYEYDETHPWIDGTSPEDWEKFSITLSDDAYHDPINPAVRERFRVLKHELRDVTKYGVPSNMGAAKENGVGGDERCCCTELHVKPDGSLFMCGDDGSLPLGNVLDYDEDSWAGLKARVWDTEDIHGMCGYYGLGRDIDEDGEALTEHEYTAEQYKAVAEYITGEGDLPAFLEDTV